MTRSEINSLIREALAFFARHQFHLPPFAHWTPEEWRAKGRECREIVDNQLGWDITDFGRGDYGKYGLFLFTVRNGRPGGDDPHGKTYCEKIMIAKENQRTPNHLHKGKVEDIINRGGGNLVIQLWNSTIDDGLASSSVTVSMDGVEKTLPAGGTLTLRPGDSITLPAGLYHEFWGETGQGMVLVGEVSKVNDDSGDNYFYEPAGRFPEIDEDEEPYRLLVSDYARWYGA